MAAQVTGRPPRAPWAAKFGEVRGHGLAGGFQPGGGAAGLPRPLSFVRSRASPTRRRTSAAPGGGAGRAPGAPRVHRFPEREGPRGAGRPLPAVPLQDPGRPQGRAAQIRANPAGRAAWLSTPHLPEARETSPPPLSPRPQPLQPEEGGETPSVTSRAPERSDAFILFFFLLCAEPVATSAQRDHKSSLRTEQVADGRKTQMTSLHWALAEGGPPGVTSVGWSLRFLAQLLS